ncbi:hypothetical protein HYC85_021755 [Camellia sinensis]|uniref:Splicing factor YJU2 n=1 Tax=Camellia sinensis TaxID=4442 RepID=A0A7J7GMI0_CAMSI|nr:hypothetical protein HYC85_021755 [Camellia sinensis]
MVQIIEIVPINGPNDLVNRESRREVKRGSDSCLHLYLHLGVCNRSDKPRRRCLSLSLSLSLSYVNGGDEKRSALATVVAIDDRRSATVAASSDQSIDLKRGGEIDSEGSIHTERGSLQREKHRGEMGERKVLNKYYPPDFDPAKIPRRRQPKNKQMKVQMMLPMSIRCGTCGNYIYKGTKFNSRKEDVIGECSAELTIKTDPQNSDYVVESGASRNFEPWRAEDEEADKEKQKRETEEMGDAMKSLENRTLDSKREMDILAALDEVKSMRSRQATISVDAMLEVLQRSAEEKAPREFVRRIDDIFDDDEDLSQISTDNAETSNNNSKV